MPKARWPRQLPCSRWARRSVCPQRPRARPGPGGASPALAEPPHGSYGRKQILINEMTSGQLSFVTLLHLSISYVRLTDSRSEDLVTSGSIFRPQRVGCQGRIRWFKESSLLCLDIQRRNLISCLRGGSDDGRRRFSSSADPFAPPNGNDSGFVFRAF